MMHSTTLSIVPSTSGRFRAVPTPPRADQASSGPSTHHGDGFDVMTGVPSEDVAERWQALLYQHLMRREGLPGGASVVVGLPDVPAFCARVRSGTLGGVHYCHQVADAHRARIGGVARAGSGRQLAIVQLSGVSRVTAGPHQERLCPGEMLLIHQVEELALEHEGQFEQLILVLQMAEGPGGLPVGLRSFHQDDPLAKLAFRLARDSCLAAEAIPSRLAGDIARTLSGLLTQALAAPVEAIERRTAGGGINSHAIEDYIEQRLSDPCLSLRRIAQAFGCNVRTLHRAFSRDGLPSLARYLWHKRLEASAALLRAPAMASRTLTEVALDLGFSSSAHFSTLFREAFGVSPSEYRRRFQRAATVGPLGEPGFFELKHAA